MKNDFVIQRKETECEFNFGRGISEKAWEIVNLVHITTTRAKPSSPRDPATFLRKLYQLDPDLDEETCREVMAVYSEMRMNIFNSTAVIIARTSL